MVALKVTVVSVVLFCKLFITFPLSISVAGISSFHCYLAVLTEVLATPLVHNIAYSTTIYSAQTVLGKAQMSDHT